ncbi:MAG: 23S rRNA (adenine(2503)-C(2))-methyltransferase RlmN [Dysgonamonadaceae bacterium]|jgi:23S rRNA (adenine2503-C2)-methyltransferase|nr:23S rRNA (adenine(2503)-C(2))-methyltransferase RlmN [Dysgonamonadaceae bacterium]
MQNSPLLGLTLGELSNLATTMELPAFAAKQMAGWLYKKRVKSIEEMTNLSVATRLKLSEKYEVGCSAPVKFQQSKDETIKYLFRTSGKQYVETVYIPDEDRATLCVSTHVGCKMNCLFCMTGKQGFSGNLTAAEILNQIQSVPESQSLTNIVFMGMGEPLDNIVELFKVLEILTSEYAYAWSPKRITVSTIGLLPGLQAFLENSHCHLAVSLHTPFEDERLKLMPVEKASPLRKVLELVRKYDFAHQRRVSFEYIMFNGLNDGLYHARELVRLLSGIPCRVNLIRYHVIPGIDLPSSDPQKMVLFRDFLTSKGIICTIRASRGEDILAACGMLSTQNS